MISEKYIQRLRQKGHRITPKLRAVIELFLHNQRVLGAFEVHSALQNEFEALGLPTVYRILDNLAKAGILMTFVNKDRELRYFICRQLETEHHHHFICKSCGKVDEVQLCIIDKVSTFIKNSLQADVQDHFLQLEGLCSKCS